MEHKAVMLNLCLTLCQLATKVASPTKLQPTAASEPTTGSVLHLKGHEIEIDSEVKLPTS